MSFHVGKIQLTPVAVAADVFPETSCNNLMCDDSCIMNCFLKKNSFADCIVTTVIIKENAFFSVEHIHFETCGICIQTLRIAQQSLQLGFEQTCFNQWAKKFKLPGRASFDNGLMWWQFTMTSFGELLLKKSHQNQETHA